MGETPEDWTEVQNCPTIHRLTDGNDVERLIVLGGKNGSMMQAISEDLGVIWSAMRPTGLSLLCHQSPSNRFQVDVTWLSSTKAVRFL